MSQRLISVKKIRCAIVSLLVTAACTTAAQHRVATGTIVGRMHATGGPAPGFDGPIIGQVAITDANTHVLVVKVITDRDGRFRATVPVGNYLLEGTSPNITSSLQTGASVMAEATTTVSLELMMT